MKDVGRRAFETIWKRFLPIPIERIDANFLDGEWKVDGAEKILLREYTMGR